MTELSTWAPVDPAGYLDGTHVPPVADIFVRDDGQGLMYPGLVHSFHGESESGKSLLMQLAACQLIARGEDVLYLDFESDPGAVFDRLLSFGADPADILDHFCYARPDGKPTPEDWRAVTGRRYTLAVIDGVTAAYSTLGGVDSNSADAVTGWMRTYPRRIAADTGAAVALVDHVSKSAESRGRFATGSQAKMSNLDGAAYLVDVDRVLGKGLSGSITVKLCKDRPATLRRHCGPQSGDRMQLAAKVTIDSRNGGVPLVTIEAPELSPTDTPAQFRPTWLMEKTSRYIELNPGAGVGRIENGVGGAKKHITSALAVLVAEGYVRISEAPGGKLPHTSIRPYRQAEDPLSDQYPGDGKVSVPEPRQPSPPSLPPLRGRGKAGRSLDHPGGKVAGTSREGGKVSACRSCNEPLDAANIADGFDLHPFCTSPDDTTQPVGGGLLSMP